MALVEIAVSNTRARIRCRDKHVREGLLPFLTYFQKTAPYQKPYQVYLRDRDRARKEHRKPRGWNGTVCLYRESDDSFPAGLLDRVVKKLKDDGDDVVVYDRRERPGTLAELQGGVLLANPRDWQTGAFKAAQQHERGIFEAATGTGKTTLMAQIITSHAQPSLVLVNRNTIAKQAVERFDHIINFPHAKNPFGIIGDNVWQPGLITVATYQTLHTMLQADEAGTTEWLKQFTALHIDEAHHVPARTFFDLTNATEGSFYRYGYSATPFKKDRETELRLVGVCGEIIYSYSAVDAIAAGDLLPPRIYFVDHGFPLLAKAERDPDGEGHYQGKFGDEYKEGIVEHVERNHLLANLASLCAEAKLPTLVFVRQNAQGRRLRQLIDESEYVNGQTDTAGRTDAKARLASGELPALIASTIFDEGEDIPAIGAVVRGGGYSAEHLSIQQVGRGLRPSEGLEFVLIFDCYDRHSFRLERHSKSRVKALRDAGFEVHIVTIDELAALMDEDGFFG